MDESMSEIPLQRLLAVSAPFGELRQASGDEDARTILLALNDHETGGDDPDLILYGQDRKTAIDLEAAWYRIELEKLTGETGTAEAEPVVSSFPNSETRDLAKGGGGSSGSGSRGKNMFRGATTPLPHTVEVSDEETLLGLIKSREDEVAIRKDVMNLVGSKGTRDIDKQQPFHKSLEELAMIKTALKERRLEKWWFGFYSLYQRTFKWDEWNQDQLYLKLKGLRKISLTGGITPPEAQLAINRLSFLEYKGFNFSEEQGQLIEKLSKQAESLGSSEHNKEFQLTSEDEEVIKNMAWARVVGKIVEEITMKMNYFKPMAASGNEDARTILLALDAMHLIMGYDTARWSSETTRLLQNIKTMKTGGDNPNLILDNRDLKAINDLEVAWRRIKLEKPREQTAAAADSVPTSQAVE
ncbi:hypothetical protein H4Q26_016270 [Puccinia striiformis f. sp. tritici PST-130]|nr:hypothetical protein H4Q26_016270 [Puccinia striiformis f. sp. tritici PST-130]